VEELLEEGTAGQPHPAASIHTPVSVQQQLLKHLQEQHTLLEAVSLSVGGSVRAESPTFMPLSQLIHRSPLVRKQATACRARWWIQPSCLSCVMMASIQGKPVRPSAHLASASGFWSHGIWRQANETNLVHLQN